MKSGRTCISRAAHSDWTSLRDSAASAIGARSAQLVRWVDLHLIAADEYHVLIAGMERISVDLGQFVVNGRARRSAGRRNPMGRCQSGRWKPRRTLRGVRKDGIQIDPGPW